MRGGLSSEEAESGGEVCFVAQVGKYTLNCARTLTVVIKTAKADWALKVIVVSVNIKLINSQDI